MSNRADTKAPARKRPSTPSQLVSRWAGGGNSVMSLSTPRAMAGRAGISVDAVDHGRRLTDVHDRVRRVRRNGHGHVGLEFQNGPVHDQPRSTLLENGQAGLPVQVFEGF